MSLSLHRTTAASLTFRDSQLVTCQGSEVSGAVASSYGGEGA